MIHNDDCLVLQNIAKTMNMKETMKEKWKKKEKKKVKKEGEEKNVCFMLQKQGQQIRAITPFLS